IYCAALQAKTRSAVSAHIDYIRQLAREVAKYQIFYPVDSIARMPGQYQMSDAVQMEIFNLALTLAK
ncbi:MAG: hypothetical protein ACKO0Z_07635, partial [Betaproteobacteria bacterium]